MEKFSFMRHHVAWGICDRCGRDLQKRYWIREFDGEAEYLCPACAAFALADAGAEAGAIEYRKENTEEKGCKGWNVCTEPLT